MAEHKQPLLFEISRPGRIGVNLPACDVEPAAVELAIPKVMRRSELPELPEISEVEAVRHYTGLSRRNYGVDNGFYPLGSCTMKYNPKVNEDVANLPGFKHLHPLQYDQTVQGALALMYELQLDLAEIAGMDACTLQPAAGAHGELTGLKLIRAFHESRGEQRSKIIVPDSAHGTNPATASACGLEIIEIASEADGSVNLDALKAAVGPDTAALMLTNPSTLGLFERNICEIAEIVHSAGGLLYYDGANANALMGIARPGDMGFDVVHFNLHKTFSTPHGGGGPGSGPVAVKAALEPFLPAPVVEYDGHEFYMDFHRPQSIGKMHTFHGNFAVYLRAYAYIRSMGPDGLKQASLDAVLNANYIKQALADDYQLPFERHVMHECVFAGLKRHADGVKTLDVAKRLLDYGYHPPTIYFPLIVHEALMIEPTETESKETLDAFIAVMKTIAREAVEQPEVLLKAPQTTPVSRLDEVTAARKPNVRWKKP